MNWFVNLYKKLGHSPEPIEVSKLLEDSAEAEEIFNSAKAALGEARRRREDVHQVASSLATLRVENHFAESIRLSMTQGKN